jgi:hypothetical protein
LTSFAVLGVRSEGNEPKKKENQQLISPSRRCFSAPVGFDQGFLSKEQCDDTEHPPHSPDLPTACFYLFPQMKSALKGWRFCNITDINKNATEELKRISQNGSNKFFQQLYSRW